MSGELRERVLRPLAQHQAEAGEAILRHMLRSVAEQTLDYLRVGLAAGIGALVEQAEGHARNELATLEQMVAQRESNEPGLRGAMEEVTRIRAELGER